MTALASKHQRTGTGASAVSATVSCVSFSQKSSMALASVERACGACATMIRRDSMGGSMRTARQRGVAVRTAQRCGASLKFLPRSWV
eukprot:3369341-Lingulodinium_polyedra.AAC.1